MTLDTSPEAIAALRENARNAGKEGAGMHRNAGDSGRVAALWIEAQGGNARAADPLATTIARLTAERDALLAEKGEYRAYRLDDGVSFAIADSGGYLFGEYVPSHTAWNEAIRAAAEAAHDRTPDKHTAVLASHVTGRTIENAILALLKPEKKA